MKGHTNNIFCKRLEQEILFYFIYLFHRPMAEANAKEGALASHGKRGKKMKERR